VVGVLREVWARFAFKITDTLLVLFTGLLWWSTHRLWNETRKGGNASGQSKYVYLSDGDPQGWEGGRDGRDCRRG